LFNDKKVPKNPSFPSAFETPMTVGGVGVKKHLFTEVAR
jgi:hypothetical protein